MRGTSPASSFSVLPSISLRHSPTLFTLRSLSSTSPLDGVVMPSAFLTLGLRRSISTKITRAPFLLSASARFVETVVLPSPGIVLVTSIAWHLPLSSRRKSFILRLRMLSWKEPDTRLFNIESVFTLCCLRFLNVTLGSVARQVWFSFMRISSGPMPSIGDIVPPSTWYVPRNSRIFSMATTSLASLTTHITPVLRLASRHMAQGSVSV